MKISKGDVFWVDFSKVFPDGEHYQRGIRPAVIVSNNYNNSNCTTVNVVPLTTRNDGLPQHRYVDIQNGLRQYILPEMITTIDKKYLGNKLPWHIEKSQYKQIQMAIDIQLGNYKGGWHYE